MRRNMPTHKWPAIFKGRVNFSTVLSSNVLISFRTMHQNIFCNVNIAFSNAFTDIKLDSFEYLFQYNLGSFPANYLSLKDLCGINLIFILINLMPALSSQPLLRFCCFFQNSIRHNLSLNKCFQKLETPSLNGTTRKACLWGLNEDKIARLDEDILKLMRRIPDSKQGLYIERDLIALA